MYTYLYINIYIYIETIHEHVRIEGYWKRICTRDIRNIVQTTRGSWIDNWASRIRDIYIAFTRPLNNIKAEVSFSSFAQSFNFLLIHAAAAVISYHNRYHGNVFSYYQRKKYRKIYGSLKVLLANADIFEQIQNDWNVSSNLSCDCPDKKIQRHLIADIRYLETTAQILVCLAIEIRRFLARLLRAIRY